MLKQLMSSVVMVGISLLAGAAQADTVVSASSGAAWYPPEATCFARGGQGRISIDPSSGCGSRYWTIDLWNANTTGVTKTFSVFGQHSTTGCGINCPATKCSAVVVNSAGDFVTWTGQHVLNTTAGWKTLTPNLFVPDDNTSQVECLISNLTNNWVGSARVSGTL